VGATWLLGTQKMMEDDAEAAAPAEKRKNYFIWATDPSGINANAKSSSLNKIRVTIVSLARLPRRVLLRMASIGHNGARAVKRWWEDLHGESREKLLFGASTTIGVITFWSL